MKNSSLRTSNAQCQMLLKLALDAGILADGVRGVGVGQSSSAVVEREEGGPS
jgi:hypothetical protein